MASISSTKPSAGVPEEEIPGLLGEFYDSEQDKLEDSNDYVRDRSLYVKVANSPFKGKSQNDIARGIEVGNDQAFHPEFLNLFIRKETLYAKLIFDTKELRDSVYANNNFKFEGSPVKLELPRSDGGLTVYLHGIPLQASHGFVTTWLHNNFGATLVEGTEVKFCAVPGCTKIKSTARSAVVKIPPGHTIPGFALMSSKLGEVAKIRIRYTNCGLWCRKCFGQGHKAKQCKMGSWVKAPNLGRQTERHFDPPASPTFSPTKPSLAFRPGGSQPRRGKSPVYTGGTTTDLTIDDLTVSNWAKEQEDATSSTSIAEFSDGFPKGILAREYPNKMTGFFRSSDAFSNRYPAKFTIDEKEFHSTEHYFFSMKAQHLHDAKAATAIEKVKKDPIAIAKIGNKLTITDSNYSAKAWRWLWDSNCAKFEQNPALLTQLFKTNSTRLVLCSKDKFWGCGIDSKDELWRDINNWIGKNVFGDLLTHLRRQLMGDPKHASVVASVTGQKRKPTSPIGNNKMSKNDDSEEDSNDDSEDPN